MRSHRASILSVSTVLLLCGCAQIPLRIKQINVDLFDSEEIFLDGVKVLQYSQGRPKDEVLAEINPILLKRLRKEEPAVLPILLYPGANFLPHTVLELEAYETQKISPYDAYSFQYQNIEEWIVLSTLHHFNVLLGDDGVDNKVFLIVKRGDADRIYRVIVALVPRHTRDKVYLWQAGIDLASGSIPQLGKSAVSALGF